MSGTTYEVQGHFQSNAQLEAAFETLKQAGYDRADVSAPDDQADQDPAAPPIEGALPVDHIDVAQVRTMGTSMAGYAGAAAVAGVTLATGGAAGVAVAAAAAVGLGSGLAANAAGQAAEAAQVQKRDDQGGAGKLVLGVRTRTDAETAEVTAILQRMGATGIRQVDQAEEMLTAGISSASWTG